jgi:5-methylcytosine-specific restriction endonuclease McrA
MEAKRLAKRPYTGDNKKQKFEYQCNHCKNWFKDSETQIDHVIPTGSLLSWDDVVPFLQKLIPEDVSSFQVLCKECHQTKTNKEREER